MTAFHRRNNKKEVVVGWYTTTTINGEFIIDNSSLINDFYCNQCTNPIHLVVDTTLMGDDINTRGFISKDLSVMGEVLASSFHEVKVELVFSDAEASCLYHMLHDSTKDETANSSNNDVVTVLTTLPNASGKLQDAMEDLKKLLDSLQIYVDQVVDGKLPPNREIGIAIATALNSFTSSQSSSTSQHTVLNNRYQDVLMASYISTLIQTQVQIAEKINQIL